MSRKYNRVVNMEILEGALHNVMFSNDEIFDGLDFCDYNSEAVKFAIRVHGNIQTLYYIIHVLFDEHRKVLDANNRLQEYIDKLEAKNAGEAADETVE